jgi:hypothetical protein
MENEKLTILEQLERSRITAGSDIQPHEFLFQWNGTPCFARGELVAVTGKAKSGKTYLNSLLMAAAGVSALSHGAGDELREPNNIRQNGRSIPAYHAGLIDKGHFLGLERMREKPFRVVWIDTEQSADSTHEILRDRIGAMIGAMPSDEGYHVFNLRQIPWKERMVMVLSAVAICQPDLVIFDGIRDVVGDINNYEEAQNTIGQLLQLASEYRTCIVCVLHQNKAVEDKTLRGALGTELQNKSFETYECSKNSETRIFTVKQTATRKYDMPGRVDFCLTAEGLPMACGSVKEDSVEGNEKSGFNPVYVGADGKIDKGRLFGYILAEGRQMGLAQLRQVVMKVANVQSFNFAFRLIEEARMLGIIEQAENEGKNYYQLCTQEAFLTRSLFV